MFSLKIDTVMQSSKLGYQTWAIAVYQAATNLKGISSLKLRRDLGITQKSAWRLMHRIRKAFEGGQLRPFKGPVEVEGTAVAPFRASSTRRWSAALRCSPMRPGPTRAWPSTATRA